MGEFAAEMMGQSAGLGAEASGIIPGAFNEQYAEFFGEMAGRTAGLEFGNIFKKQTQGLGGESPAAELIKRQTPSSNPLFAQMVIPELARQMDLWSLMFARGSMTFTGAAS